MTQNKKISPLHDSSMRLVFIFFALLASGFGLALWGAHLSQNLSLMFGFDAATLIYIVTCYRLLHLSNPKIICAHAQADDAYRIWLPGLALLAGLVAFAVVFTEVSQSGISAIIKYSLSVGTILLAWLFINLVYTLHYAHMHYGTGKGCDAYGLFFPGKRDYEPDYWDFLYFSFTNGMAFATSDVNIESPAIRRVVVVHCLGTFIFNIGVIGFTINILAGLHS